jgi:uncharacterized damage-inducible protein DinB
MLTPAYCRMMAHYNQWMNRTIYLAVDALDENIRRKHMGAFFGSIHATLQHLLWADLYWVRRLSLFELLKTEHSITEDSLLPWEQLRAMRTALDERLIAWAQKVSEVELNADHSYLGKDGTKRIPVPGLWILQMFNHQTHHRGQVTTLLSQLNIDIGATDMQWAPTAITKQPAD